VRAYVVEAVQLAVSIARKDKRSTGHIASDVTPALRDFGLMAKIEPTLVKDLFLFEREDRLVDKDSPVDAKPGVTAVVIDEAL